MNIHCDCIGVDAGLIAVFDYDYMIKESRGESQPTQNFEIIDVEPGIYTVHVIIPESWDGRIERLFKLNVSSGKLVVSDPCYWFNEGWMSYLNKTDYCSDYYSSDHIHFISTGGDGGFEVTLIIEKENK